MLFDSEIKIFDGIFEQVKNSTPSREYILYEIDLDFPLIVILIRSVLENQVVIFVLILCIQNKVVIHLTGNMLYVIGVYRLMLHLIGSFEILLYFGFFAKLKIKVWIFTFISFFS